jgi:hypothetical protein
MKRMRLGLCLVLASCGSAATAPAANAKTTLSGYGADGLSPDSTCDTMRVSVTRTKGVLDGTLETIGNIACGGPGDDNNRFVGTVTCMKIHHERVTVGAFGTAENEYFGTKTKLHGKYAQVLTIEFGSFPSLMEGGEPYTFSFGMVGEHDEGLKSSSPSSCKHASFSDQHLPSNGGTMSLTR